MLEAKETFGLASRWGWVVTRGVLGIVFGLIAFSRPGAMAFSIVLLFGCFAFAGGIATIIAAARSGRAGDSWGALLLEGLVGIAVGAVALLWPASTALAFVWMIGVWAIVSGALSLPSGSAISLPARQWSRSGRGSRASCTTRSRTTSR